MRKSCQGGISVLSNIMKKCIFFIKVKSDSFQKKYTIMSKYKQSINKLLLKPHCALAQWWEVHKKKHNISRLKNENPLVLKLNLLICYLDTGYILCYNKIVQHIII